MPLEDLFEDYEGYTQLRIIANAGLQDPVSRKFIENIANLLATFYDNHKIEFRDKEFSDRLSESAWKYKEDPELVRHFSNWCTSRKELIRITNSAAEDLDQQLFIINIARMFGSFVEILNSLNLGIYQKFCSIIASYCYNISPKLGFIIECALELAPHLRFMGFASSFFDILRSQLVISRVVNAIKNDEDMFTSLKEWCDETKKLDDSVQKLFPYGINKDITKNIEKAVKDLGKEEKIFTATVLSNVKEDQLIYKNGKFLAEVFLFCRSDAAKDWYKRLITGASPADLEYGMLCLRNQLQQLEGEYADSATKLEMGKSTVNQMENITKNSIRSILGRIVVCSMSGMSIYCCYGNMRAGSKHRYSDTLRELSKNAQSLLNAMEKIRS